MKARAKNTGGRPTLPKTKIKLASIGVRLEQEYVSKLTRHSALSGIPKAVVCRNAIKYYLDKLPKIGEAA